MAVLTNEQRFDVWKSHMQEMSARREQDGGLDKRELYDVFVIADDNLDGFLETLKSNITSKAQLALTDAQWQQIIINVIQKRMIVSSKDDVKGGK